MLVLPHLLFTVPLHRPEYPTKKNKDRSGGTHEKQFMTHNERVLYYEPFLDTENDCRPDMHTEELKAQ